VRPDLICLRIMADSYLSGMTFGSDVHAKCISNFLTPLVAHAQISTSPAYRGASVTPVYDYISSSGKTAVTISNTTTITAGLAVADPIIVAWQIADLKLFPSEYASSLANKIGIALPSSTPTAPSPPLTNAPADPSNPNILSTGATAGIAVGAMLGAVIIGVIIGVIIVALCLRRRRKAVPITRDSEIADMEDQDRGLHDCKWFFGGRWRSEVVAELTQNELDSKIVHVVPGPPAELEATEPRVENRTSLPCVILWTGVKAVSR
jgi:hypothetical protein